MSDEPLATPPGFRIKRVYEAPDPDDGYRVLVDRLWPRGVAKSAAHLDEWAKDLTPSNELRRWYHENPPGRHDEFVARFREELSDRTAHEAIVRLRGLARTRPPVTLVTAVKDPANSHLPVLLEFLGQ